MGNGVMLNGLSYRAHPRPYRMGWCGQCRVILLCPDTSDVHLFGHGERVVDLDAEIAHRVLHLHMTQKQLYCAHVTSAAIALVRRSECVPKKRGSSPTLVIRCASPRRYRPISTATTAEREFARAFITGCDIIF